MRTEFIISSPGLEKAPPTDLPEFAFTGRSNVGKSSLLNRLCGARIARSSQTPGRTQLINFFRVHTGPMTYVFADLPGFGYARTPKSVKRAWPAMIEGYLGGRAEICAVLFLVDARRGAEPKNVELFRDLSTSRRDPGSTWVVVTKLDKLPKAKMKPTMAQIARGLGADPQRIFGTSATSGLGIEALREAIAESAKTY